MVGLRAFLFPGQGSQAVGMGRDLWDRFPEARDLFERADDLLGFALSRVCFEGPMDQLSQTEVTQPAVYVHSVAAAQRLAARGIGPQAVAGHSLGEYSALAVAGVLDFAAGLALVRQRGLLMQAAGARRPGKMAAVLGLGDAAVAQLCTDAGPGVAPANFNAPGQVVVSGEAEAVERAARQALQVGARRVVELPVSGAFHSPLMEPAARQLASRLEAAQFRAPRVPVVTNVTAGPVTDPAQLRRLLVEQMTAPVRWTQSVRALRALGVDRALEVGPGTALRGLVRRIDPEMDVQPAGTADEIEAIAADGSEEATALEGGEGWAS